MVEETDPIPGKRQIGLLDGDYGGPALECGQKRVFGAIESCQTSFGSQLVFGEDLFAVFGHIVMRNSRLV